MPRLVVNPGTPQAWAVALKPGVNTLGRHPTNDVCLADGSVSGNHCQITLGPEGARLRDLGSTNGTFIDGAPVQETILHPGARIRLGAVELLYESLPAETVSGSGPPAPVHEAGSVQAPDSAHHPSGTAAQQAGAAIPIPPPVPGHLQARAAIQPSAAPVSVQYCRLHPRSLARAWCPQCQKAYCDLCVHTRRVEGVSQDFCRSCGSACEPVSLDWAGLVQPPKTFVAQVLGAFVYPVRGTGPFFLAFFGLALPALNWVAKYGFVAGPFAWGAMLVGLALLVGYLYACLQHFVICSAQGQAAPSWPEVTSLWQDVLSPLMRFVGLGVVCAGPSIALFVAATQGHRWAVWLLPASVVLAGVYLPMAFLAVSLFDSLTAVNPLLIVPSILKVPLPYLLVLVVLALGTLIETGLVRVLELVVQVPLISTVLGTALWLYFLAVQARLLALLYACYKERLGWFSSAT